MARVSSSVREERPEDAVTSAVRSYKVIKDEVDSLTKRQKALRDYLMETVEKAGFTDENGNVWIELPEEIEGVAALKRERRAKPVLNEEAAERVLASRDLVDECYKTIRVVDEEAVFRAMLDGRLTEAEVDEIFPVTVTWALMLK